MTTFNKSLDSYVKNEKKLGYGFEELTKWFLENHPQYKSILETVWHWDDWPDKDGGDDGIDLIAKTFSGEYWAIQSKNYDKKYYIKKTDIDSFLSESNRNNISYRLLVATTDNLGPKVRKTLINQEKPVGTLLYSQLSNDEIDWPIYEKPKKLKLETNTPDPHQKDAINDVIKSFKTDSKGQLIMACGTGKTLTSLWIDEALNNNLTCIFVPSISLIEQTFKSWILNSKNKFHFLTVCSDKTVTEDKEYDLAQTKSYELGVPTTTDEVIISKFMKLEGKKVIFSTYQSIEKIYKAQKNNKIPIDLIIGDEAHSLTGISSNKLKSSDYILKDEMLQAEKKLFMTATPKGVIKQIKNQALSNNLDVFSMDDEQTFGKVFHKLSFGKAISQNLLSDYEVITLDIHDPFVAEKIDKNVTLEKGGKNYSAFALSAQIALLKASKELKIKRIITFHNLIKKAKIFSETMEDANKLTFKNSEFTTWAKSIDGSMPAISRKHLLNQLKNNEYDLNLISNARCLSEGVDVPTLDGIAFIDPKDSVIQIIQAIGRAIRLPRNEKSKTGYIFVPVIINEDSEINLDDTSYHQIWKVFQALMAHDERLADQLKELNLNKSIYGKKSKMPKINWGDIPERINQDFVDSIESKIITEIHGSWYESFEKLINYYKKFNTSRVADTKNNEYYSLGRWVGRQRYFFRKGLLSQEKIKLLETNFHDWSFNPTDEFREKILNEWVNFNNKYGEPYLASKDSKLVSKEFWEFYKKVLRDHKKNKLSIEIKNQTLTLFPNFQFYSLEFINFKKKVDEWKEISDYENEIYLNPKVIKKHNPKYLTAQYPTQIRNGTQKLTKEFQNYLYKNFPDFKFLSIDEIKELKKRKLFEDYVKEFGTAYLRTDTKYKGEHIGRWAQDKRMKYSAASQSYKERKLSKENIEYFNQFIDLGWHWGESKIQKKDQKKELFLNYIEVNGTAYLPKRLNYQNENLGNWAHNIRVKNTLGKLSENEKGFFDQFIDIGWYWDSPEIKHLRAQKNKDGMNLDNTPKALRKESFKLFEEYVEEKGTAYIPTNEIYKGEKIGQWAIEIRHRKRATLPRYKYRKLPDDIVEYFENYIENGWTWGGKNSHLISRDKDDLKLFKEYVKEKGTAYIPTNEVYKGKNIGRWAQGVRGRYHNVSEQFKGRKLDKSTIDFLNNYKEIGWYWGKPRKYIDK